MKTTPKQFAELLANSSLLPDEQTAVLASLDQLTLNQIEALAKCLRKDSKALLDIFSKANKKNVSIVTKMHLKLQTEDTKT